MEIEEDELKRKIRKSGSICLTLVDRSVWCNILAESARMRRSYLIYRTDDVNCGVSETVRPGCFWMQMIIP